MKEKLKSFLADDSLYLASLVVGVGILAFVLGRLSVVTTEQQDARAVNPLSLCPTTICATPISPLPVATSTQTMQGRTVSNVENPAEADQYVASKTGTKYHHITCPGAKQIKEENKIYFATINEAMAAGYSKAANCNQ